jgi:uncharacterized protein (TIGR02246 family)
VSLIELGRPEDALRDLREGERLGVAPANAAYRLAQAHAEAGRRDSALAELRRALDAGYFAPPSSVDGDAHFASLRGDPSWKGVLDAFDAVVRPCLHDKRFREFDFWIGDWDVRPTGQPAAGPPSRNVITLDDNGCVLTEHWTAPNGSEGQSFNIFDRSIGKWRQTWVDNVGGQHDYRGALVNGNMVYEGDTPAPNGQLGRVPTRLTFFRLGPDSVRQFSETSADSGRTWQTAYDLTYVRRKASSAPDGPGPSGSLSAGDRAAIRALDSAFVQAWLRDDTTAVLGLFATDAVLMPPGSAPRTGQAAIRAYWWPADGSRTRITAFDRSIAEIGGSRELAFVRGTASLTWDYAKDGKSSAQKGRSTDLMLVAPDASGRWRIVRHMWNTLP